MTNVAEKVSVSKDIFCPIDVHDNFMLCGFAIGREAPRFEEFGTNRAGIGSLISRLNRLRKVHPGHQVWVAYEASGSGFRLLDGLSRAGFKAFVLAPTHLPVTVKSRSNKTDRRDVVRILEVLRGHVLAGNHLPSVWVPPRKLRDDREIVRRRLHLKEEVARTKNRIHGLLRRYGLKKPARLKTNWTKKHRRWLESVPDMLERGAGRSLKSFLRELAYLESECRELDKDVLELAGTDRYRSRVARLTQFKGVGILTSMVFLTELGDLNRFPNRRRIAGFLGLVPRSYESGENSDRKGRISKLGPARVRKVLNQAAWAAVRWDPFFKQWFKAHTPGGKGRRKANVAVMRMLAIRMWHVAREV